MKVFTTEPGSVEVTDDPSASGVTAVVSIPSLGSLKVAVTRVTVQERVSRQLTHTLGPFIYIYVFGDRVGQLGISGLAFHTTCGDGEDVAAAFAGEPIGLEEVMKFYHENKVSKNPTPLKVTIGTETTMEVFLAGANYDVVDPKDKICQFDFIFDLLPEE